KVDLWQSDDIIPRETLISKIKAKDGLLCLLTDKIDKEVLDSAGDRLQAVSTISVGVDHINRSECTMRGIKIGYTPEVLTAATAEFAVGLLLSTSRRIVEGTHAAKRSNSVFTACVLVLLVDDKTTDRVGTILILRIANFSHSYFFKYLCVQFIFFFNNNNFPFLKLKQWFVFVTSFPDLLRESDFIISCCSFNQSTDGVFDKEAFKQMKNSAIFVNIARGGVVNQDDLYDALSRNVIRGAGLDVTTPEPLPTDHPLFTLDNCVVTPHIGSASEKTRTEMTMLAVENLICALENRAMPAQY
uniref:D-isomer specific 2-hydroxyacid dehydrogenase NAD-binding domain-containing protein n=1 Tax=Ciona savignyi TaxID=51511 RepID=H2Z0K6_CIOSA